MENENSGKLFEELKELTSAVSTQAQVASRYWLGLMTAAVVSVLPLTPSNDGTLPLPFGLGDVRATWYYLVLYVILIVLTIAFSTAHAQQVRAQRLAQSFIDQLPRGYKFGHAHPRDLYDNLSCRVSTAWLLWLSCYEANTSSTAGKRTVLASRESPPPSTTCC